MFNEKLFELFKNKKLTVKYVNSYEKDSDIRILIKNVDTAKLIRFVHQPEDNYLGKNN